MKGFINLKITSIIVFVLLIFICFTALAITKTPVTSVQGWTIGTLKEYIDQRFAQLQLAVEKAEQATEKRFEGVNEFRNTLADQQRTFVPRAEFEASILSLNANVSELKAKLDKYENLKSGGSNTIAYLMAGISFLIAIIALSRNFISSVFQKGKEGVK